MTDAALAAYLAAHCLKLRRIAAQLAAQRDMALALARASVVLEAVK